MAKKILVIDTDGWTGCNGCPCLFESGFHKQYCMAARKRLIRLDRIQDYCPLRVLPEKQGLNPDIHPCYEPFDEGYIEGWNNCVDAIEGTED